MIQIGKFKHEALVELPEILIRHFSGFYIVEIDIVKIFYRNCSKLFLWNLIKKILAYLKIYKLFLKNKKMTHLTSFWFLKLYLNTLFCK